jgi:hypothetical protein
MKKKPDRETEEARPVGLSPEQIEAIFDSYPQVEGDALRSVLADYRIGKFTALKVKMLTDAGILTGQVKKGKEHTELDNDICESQGELRNRIMMHYQNPDKTSKLRREISKQEMSAWTQMKNLHGNPPPPKPIEGIKRRRSLRAWLEWFEMYMRWSNEFRLDTDTGDSRKDLSVMPMGELEQVTKRERLEKERFDIMVEKGEYVKLINAEQISAGEMSKVHLRWKNEIENVPLEKIEAKMQQVEIAPDKAAAMMDFMKSLFQGITNAIEDAAEKAQRELAQTLELDAETNKK